MTLPAAPFTAFPVQILNLPEAVALGPKDIIPPGEYIVDNVSGAQLLVLAGGGEMRPIPDGDGAPAQKPQDSAESVLFMRFGGFGDLCLLTPVLRQHKKLYPNARIAVSTMRHYHPVLAGLPYIDELLPYPVLTSQLYEFDRWVFLENAIERNPRARENHMTDLFAEIAGVSMEGAAMKPEYAITAGEALWASETYPREAGVQRVCIHTGASARVRQYPKANMEGTVNLFLRNGWEVFFIGMRGEIGLQGGGNSRLRNLTEHDLKFRHSCAVLNTADVVVAPDSIMTHIAGALGVPCVALYGAFPYQLRTAYCPTTYAIQGTGKCSPCFHHANQAKKNHFPHFCPSAARGLCQVMESIKPEAVLFRAEKIARRLEVNGSVIDFAAETRR